MRELVKRGRLRFFDALRGFSVVSMVCFHACYDLYYLKGLPLHFFEPPIIEIWRASISWTFLVVAGMMCSLSRNNLKRGLQYGGLAAAIYVVTALARVDVPISFGIIYCMAFSTVFAWIMQKVGVFRGANLAKAAVLLVAFLLCLHVPYGYVGFGAWNMALPRQLYSTEWLSWLGFPGPTFASGDYYTPLPFTLLYLAGAHVAAYAIDHGGFPAWCRERGLRPLEFVGQHPLAIYVLHQPLLLVLFGLV